MRLTSPLRQWDFPKLKRRTLDSGDISLILDSALTQIGLYLFHINMWSWRLLEIQRPTCGETHGCEGN